MIIFFLVVYALGWLFVGLSIGLFWRETQHTEYVFEAFGRATWHDMDTHIMPVIDANTLRLATIHT